MSKRDMIINPITGEIDLDLHRIVKGFSTGGQSLKDNLKIDAPQRTPNHPSSSHVVKTRVDGKDKMIRFGEQGASTAGKPKEGESDKMKAKRKSFKSRHAKNIDKGKSSAAYWADREKWAEGGGVESLDDLDFKYSADETVQGGTANQWREYGESLAVNLGDVTWADVANTVIDFTPIIGDIKGGVEGAEIISEELKTDSPNWRLIGMVGGAAVLGIIPFAGDAAKKMIMKGAQGFKKPPKNDVYVLTEPFRKFRKPETPQEAMSQMILNMKSKGQNDLISEEMYDAADISFLSENLPEATTMQESMARFVLQNKARGVDVTEEMIAAADKDYLINNAMSAPRQFLTPESLNMKRNARGVPAQDNKDLFPDEVYHFTKGTTRSVRDDVLTGGKFDSSLGNSRFNRLGTHVGTPEAANDRASFFLGPNNDSPTGGGVMPLQARLDKPFLNESGEIFEEGDIIPLMNKYADDAKIADLDIAMEEFRKDLTDNGFTHIPYKNNVEGRDELGERTVSHVMLTDRTAGDPAVLKGKFGAFEDIYDPSLMKAEGGRIQYNPDNIKRNAAALLMEADNG